MCVCVCVCVCVCYNTYELKLLAHWSRGQNVYLWPKKRGSIPGRVISKIQNKAAL